MSILYVKKSLIFDMFKKLKLRISMKKCCKMTKLQMKKIDIYANTSIHPYQTNVVLGNPTQSKG